MVIVMGMVVARMVVRMRVRNVFMFMAVAVYEIMRFEKRHVLHYLFDSSISDFALILSHNHYPIRDLRDYMNILSGRDYCLAPSA